MTLFLIILGVLFVSLLSFVGYRYMKVHAQHRNMVKLRYNRIAVLHEQLKNGQEPDSHDVLPFAANKMTRIMTYELLHSYDRKHLFPQQYMTRVLAAESHLANWLEFPTELDAIPDEMEHLQTVTIDFDGKNEHFVHYEVFRFKTHAPNRAAKYGWMLGVAGPYFDESEPYDNASDTFSRLISQSDAITPEQEAIWVHENNSKRRR